MIEPIVYRQDLGEWRRYRHRKTLASISIHKITRRVWVIAGYAPLSFEITRKEAADQLRAARRGTLT